MGVDDDGHSDGDSDQDIVIIRGEGDLADIDEELWEDIEGSKPPEWMVLKELLGIGGFTYILGGLILFFLSMNFFLGPGWLGQMMGIEGTGSINEVSDSFPEKIDLNSETFRLD